MLQKYNEETILSRFFPELCMFQVKKLCVNESVLFSDKKKSFWNNNGETEVLKKTQENALKKTEVEIWNCNSETSHAIIISINAP